MPDQEWKDSETKRDHTSAVSLYSSLDAVYNEFYEARSADGVALQVVNTGLRVAKERLIDRQTAKGQETNSLKDMFEIELATCMNECMVPDLRFPPKDQLVGRKIWYRLAKSNSLSSWSCGLIAGAARWLIYRSLYRAFEVLGVYIRAHKEVLENTKKDKELARARLALLHQHPEMFSHLDQKKIESEKEDYEFMMEGLSVRQKALHHTVVAAEDRMAALIEQYPRVNLFQELVWMVRALLESKKNHMNKLVAEGFFEDGDVDKMTDKIDVYMFQLDRMRHSIGAAWGLLQHDLKIPLISEHEKIKELRGLLHKADEKLAEAEGTIEALRSNAMGGAPNPMVPFNTTMTAAM